MSVTPTLHHQGAAHRSAARDLAQRAFSRSAGAPLMAGNRLRLLRDATENYPAWLEAVKAARHYVHFENYILADDPIGNEFADALIDDVDGLPARVGVPASLVDLADRARHLTTSRRPDVSRFGESARVSRRITV